MKVRISIPESNPRPKEGGVKHVEFDGKDERDYKFAWQKKLENTRFFNYLESTYKGTNFHEQIMIVTFNTKIVQEEANITFCKRILKRGIFCENKSFNFLGHSDSQMREKTCFMMHGTEDQIQEQLKTFGDFVEDSNVSVRAKKIGLLFEPFLQQMELTKEYRDDVSKVKTSGCGFMSRGLASKIWKTGLTGLIYPEPSALLVRYQGSQGMLVLKEEDSKNDQDRDRDKDRNKDQDRGQDRDQGQYRDQDQDQDDQDQDQDDQDHDQDQDQDRGFKFVYILDYSQPNTNAYLDAKLIMLLAARGVQVEQLKTLQKYYYRLLEDMTRNDKASIDYFQQLTGQTTVEEVATLPRAEVSCKVEEEPSGGEVPHVRILIPKARVVFGVCDPYKKLASAQCYFRPTLLPDQGKEFETEKKVFVAPIPCYYPGDIQVLELTHEKKGYENLKDCLVLPPSLAFKCGGADLRGNKFIVCWDAKLIPKRKVEPISYKLTFFERMSDTWDKCRSYFQNSPKTTKDLRGELIDHFASFKRDNLPIQIDWIYMSLAQKESGLSQTQCEQLSRMFYQATNSMVDKEVLRKKLEELSDESGTARGAGESSTETTSLLDDVEGKEKREEEVLRKKLDELSDENGTACDAGESSTETTSLLDDVEGEEKWEDLRTNHGEGSGGLLSYCTCNLLQRDGEFHVNGKILNDFKKEATRFFSGKK